MVKGETASISKFLSYGPFLSQPEVCTMQESYCQAYFQHGTNPMKAPNELDELPVGGEG